MSNTTPIMSKDEEQFMAFSGLLEWTQGVVLQSKRVLSATKSLQITTGRSNSHVTALYALHCEHHYFVIAANKLLEYREWVQSFGLCSGIDFAEIDSFPRQDIKHLRNMREHIVEYFQGNGNAKGKWVVETPDFKADASSCNGTMIGGRLDYVKFTIAAEKLLSELIKLPIPFPPHVP